MRTSVLGLLVAIAGMGSAHASDKTDVMSTLARWTDSFNTGDAKSFAMTCADQTSIVDVFPPYEWHGSGACAKWFDDAKAMEKTAGMTSGNLAVGKPTQLSVTGDVAYVAAPASYTMVVKAKPLKETAMFAMSFRKGADGWHVTGWGWANQ